METKVETSALVSGVLTDAGKLVSLEMKLLRAEATHFAHQAKRLAVLSALALIAFVPTAIFLGLTLSTTLFALTELPLWTCHLMVFLLALSASLFFLFRARKYFSTIFGEGRSD